MGPGLADTPAVKDGSAPPARGPRAYHQPANQMGLRFFSIVLPLLWAVFDAGSVRAQTAADLAPSGPAGDHYMRALALFAEREYAAAAAEFQASYALEPRREALFGQAQATRLAGDCATAKPLYEAFLATNPSPQQQEATRLALARCPGQTVPATAAPVPATAVPVPATAAKVPATAARVPAAAVPVPATAAHPLPLTPSYTPRRAWRDPWAGGLLVAGSAAAVAGAVLVVAARSDTTSAKPGEPLGEYLDRRSAAQTQVTVGTVLLLVGTAGLAGAAARYVSLAWRPGPAGSLALVGRLPF